MSNSCADESKRLFDHASQCIRRGKTCRHSVHNQLRASTAYNLENIEVTRAMRNKKLRRKSAFNKKITILPILPKKFTIKGSLCTYFTVFWHFSKVNKAWATIKSLTYSIKKFCTQSKDNAPRLTTFHFKPTPFRIL